MKEKNLQSLSSRQQNILKFVVDFIKENGYAPSVREVAKNCSISSPSIVQYHLNILKRKGYISRGRNISRSIDLANKATNFTAVPLVGTIAAGQPIPVPSADTWNTKSEETIALPSNLTSGRENTYALRVKGTSMIGALIDDGDIVIMQHTNTANNGDMVAVWLKDEREVTLKRIYREPLRIRLEPANWLMRPMYYRTEDVEVQGKVIGVIRKL